MMKINEILARLQSQTNPINVEGMARFGINTSSALGIPIKILRPLAAEIKKTNGRDHALALQLWDSGIHEARILASIIDDPKQVTESQMEFWAAEFNSWDLVDQTCSNLFDKTPFACSKALEWSNREPEFVRRAGFTMMACIASHLKTLPDSDFEPFFQAIIEQSCDERNFVKKAVNWALRGIGKRNPALRVRAVEVSNHLLTLDSRAARWIARDALRELT
jgi:3-methyladenine DNA glycosylase AlkD